VTLVSATNLRRTVGPASYSTPSRVRIGGRARAVDRCRRPGGA